MNETRRPSYPRERSHSSKPMDSNIRNMIKEIEEKLSDSLLPESKTELNSFERKLIHRHFDHNPSFETRTYRDGDRFTLLIYPVENLKKFARAKALESLDSGADIELDPMGSFERYIIHNEIQEIAGVETVSLGEGKERHVKIISKKFGRGLKKIARKIRLF